jgi:hypothetical protein
LRSIEFLNNTTMKSQLISTAILGALATACQQPADLAEVSEPTKTIRFALANTAQAGLATGVGGSLTPSRAEGDDGMEIGSWGEGGSLGNLTLGGTRAATRGDEEDNDTVSVAEVAKRFIVCDYINGTLQKQITQTSSDSDFGRVEIPMKLGKHELHFVAHNSTEETVSYYGWTFPKVTDTYSLCAKLTVADTTAVDQTVVLSRVVAMVRVTALDAIPENAASLRISLSKAYTSLDVRTGYSAVADSTTLSRTFSYSASNLGSKGTYYTLYTFTPEEKGYYTTITIEGLDADSKVISKKEVKSVSVEPNHRTLLTGLAFREGYGFTVSVDSAWGDDLEYSF